LNSGDNSLVTAVSIQMRAEVLFYSDNSLKGVLYSQYLNKPFEFSSLIQMIEKMEDIFDVKSFPQAFMTPRVFKTTGNTNNRTHELDGNIDMKDKLNPMTHPESSSTKCTFEISVKFRQNATWQGQILWAEKNAKQNFRSVLEMLKLMDEAIAESGGQSEPIAWG